MVVVSNGIPEAMWGTTVYSILFPHTSPYFIEAESVIAWYNTTIANDEERMEEFREMGSVDIYAHKVSSVGDLISSECVHVFDFESEEWI